MPSLRSNSRIPNSIMLLVALQFVIITCCFNNKLVVQSFISPVRLFASRTTKASSSPHWNHAGNTCVVPRVLERAEHGDMSSISSNRNNKTRLSSISPKAKDPVIVPQPSIESTPNEETPIFLKQTTAVAAVAAIAALFLLSQQQQAFHSAVMNFDVSSFLNSVVLKVEEMGPNGVLYFALFYVLAEVLALPSMPLTASAGYLFGWQEGTAVVLVSATVAAAISFTIARTFLRDYVEGLLETNPKFKLLDRAIGKEGFKVMLLVRLSPIFPFALSNYLYGATSIGFWPFIFGTMLGFAPGTFAYVYSGEVGKSIFTDGTSGPWYLYTGGLALFLGVLKLVTDFAAKVIADLEAEDAVLEGSDSSSSN